MVRGTSIWCSGSSCDVSVASGVGRVEEHSLRTRATRHTPHATRVRSLILAGAALLALPHALLAQHTVTGTVTLEERSGSGRGDVRSAVVYLEAQGSVPSATDAPELRTAAILMRGREFIPHVRYVLAGGSVAFPNEDPFKHNVFSNVELGPFDLGLYRSRESRSARFDRPGVYPIYCNIHSKMASFVVAVPSRWVASPGADGRFALRDVPAGTYVLHAWHERGAADATREVVVGAGGARDVQLTIDARTYVTAPHLNKFGLPYAVIRADKY
jgi:plastocyanin